jgi:hypothetical protein
MAADNEDMRSNESKVLFKWDAVVVGLIVLAIAAIAIPWCSGTGQAVQQPAGHGASFVIRHQG